MNFWLLLENWIEPRLIWGEIALDLPGRPLRLGPKVQKQQERSCPASPCRLARAAARSGHALD